MLAAKQAKLVEQTQQASGETSAVCIGDPLRPVMLGAAEKRGTSKGPVAFRGQAGENAGRGRGAATGFRVGCKLSTGAIEAPLLGRFPVARIAPPDKGFH